MLTAKDFIGGAYIRFRNVDIRIFDSSRIPGQNLLWRNLSRKELSKASSLNSALNSQCYATSRGKLRQILGMEIGVQPSELQFELAACHTCGKPHGKPSVRDAQDIHFSLSRAAPYFAIAIGPKAVGVDIERIQPENPSTELIRFYSPPEKKLIETLAPELQSCAIAALWTRKEAYLKMTGEGLTETSRLAEIDLGSLGVLRRFIMDASVNEAASNLTWTVAA